jgi:hypothetical protein
MGGDFVCFVAENKQWNLLPHNTSLSQYIIQIPVNKNKLGCISNITSSSYAETQIIQYIQLNNTIWGRKKELL